MENREKSINIELLMILVDHMQLLAKIALPLYSLFHLSYNVTIRDDCITQQCIVLTCITRAMYRVDRLLHTTLLKARHPCKSIGQCHGREAQRHPLLAPISLDDYLGCRDK
jgi:hypothetical protein